MLKWLLLVASAAACAAQDAESRTVQTAQGPVKGYKTDGVFYFYGIPYATAPTGTRRFTAPLPGPVWMNTLEAVNNKIICPQGNAPVWSADMSTFDMRENCLVANIYVPDTEETNLPVFINVHGGGYLMGYGEMFQPTPLARTKKVVAVTFNYRLGVHGFLCLGTKNAPGNAGMKDQVALLRWVQKNIANFGGNPDDVTISGCSAGGSAVDLLMLSEMTNGLYNKVIPESGANLAVYSAQVDPIQNAKDFARGLNFTKTDDINKLEEFYTSVSYDFLTPDMLLQQKDTNFMFTPCLERDTGVEKFLSDSPFNILTQGKYRKVPVLYGISNMEGLFRVPLFEQWKEIMNANFSEFLPADLQFKNDDERDRVAQEVKEFYFGNELVSVDNIQGYIDYFTDVMFAYPHLRSVTLQVNAGSDSLYLYEYSYFKPIPEDFPVPKFMRDIKGANHCSQTFAVHDSDTFPDHLNDSPDYNRMRKVMVELWVNFITTGKPVPEGSDLPSWPPVGADRSPHMSLGEVIKLKGPLLEKRALFWDGIYERFYRTPVAPSTPNVRSEL